MADLTLTSGSDLTLTDLITAGTAVVALGLSVYNTYVQRRDRKPRVDLRTYWRHPSDAPMALRGTANPVAPAGKAIYCCDVTNIGVAGVKITQVTIFGPLAPPGKPVALQLPEGESPQRLENGDSQTWSITTAAITEPTELEKKYPPDSRAQVGVVAMDTVGNSYEAKNPEPYPYHRYFLRRM